MIKLTYKTLNSQSFNEAIQTLAKAKLEDFQAGYNLSRLIKQVGKELETARQTYAKWSGEFYETDEKGNYILAETPNQFTPYKFKEGVEETFVKKLAEFLETTVEIKSYALKPSDLIGVKLSAQDISALEPIFDLTSFYPQESQQPGTPLLT